MELHEVIASSQGTRRRVAQRLAQVHDEIVALSLDIHAHPEEAFTEHRSAAAIVNLLSRHGFATTLGVGRLPTAFTAKFGDGPTVIALCAEYDALPNGHACGHNIILGAAVAAALGLAAIADELGITVKVIGTPAEEHGAGKVYLLQDGAFDDCACALMVHPNPADEDRSMRDCTSQAVSRWRATFTGRASHAAGAPELGVNAGDAVVIAQVALGLLRQQVRDGYRAAMIVREGGVATNIIPERAVVDLEVRAPVLEEFWRLFERVRACLEAGALATGCGLEITQLESTYEPLCHDPILVAHVDDALASLGRDVSYRPNVMSASTDFGNVSQWLPAIHPWLSVRTTREGLHSDGFREAAAGDGGMETLFDGALAMAWAVVSLMASPDDVAELARRQAERQPYPIAPIPGDVTR